jgi:hypothetical protein
LNLSSISILYDISKYLLLDCPFFPPPVAEAAVKASLLEHKPRGAATVAAFKVANTAACGVDATTP